MLKKIFEFFQLWYIDFEHFKSGRRHNESQEINFFIMAL